MVHYPNPKYIKKSHLRGARPFVFSAVEKRADQVATTATCMRCAQNVSSQKKVCNKPEHVRCEHCADGNRGGCTLVPKALHGRMNRVYQLRGRYDTAVTNAAVPRTDAAVISAGVKLARCQRQFNLELSHSRRVAAHTGTPLGVPTQVPTTSPQYLGLLLVEQRRIATALEQLLGHAARMAGGGGGGDDDDESSDGSEGAQDGGDGGAGGAPDVDADDAAGADE